MVLLISILFLHSVYGIISLEINPLITAYKNKDEVITGDWTFTGNTTFNNVNITNTSEFCLGGICYIDLQGLNQSHYNDTNETPRVDALYANISKFLAGDSLGNHTAEKNLNMNDFNINEASNVSILDRIFLGDQNHWIKKNSSELFNGIGSAAVWIHHNVEHPAGAIAFLVTMQNNTLMFNQFGRNNSAGLWGNSLMIMPNTLAKDPFFNLNMSKISNCLEVYDFYNVTSRIVCDTDGYGASLIVQGGIHIFKELFIGGRDGFSSGIRSEGTANFIMNGNDFDVFNGSAHVQTPITCEFGFDKGDNIDKLNVGFSGNIVPFVNNQTDIGNWVSLNTAFCDNEDCAFSSAAGLGVVGMVGNFDTTDTNQSNISFVYSLVKLIGGGIFTVYVSNSSHTEQIYSDTTNDVLLSSQIFPLNNNWQNQSDLNITFLCDFGTTAKPDRQCYVNTVKINGSAMVSTLSNQSGFNSEICFGDGMRGTDGNCTRGFFYSFCEDKIFSNGIFNFTGEAGSGVSGSGTANNIAKWSTSTSLTNSNMVDTGSLITIGSDVNIDSGSLDVFPGNVAATNFVGQWNGTTTQDYVNHTWDQWNQSDILYYNTTTNKWESIALLTGFTGTYNLERDFSTNRISWELDTGIPRWSQTLAASPSTSGQNPLITGGDQVRFGSGLVGIGEGSTPNTIEVSANDFGVSRLVYHVGDNNNNINFQNDQATYKVGNLQYILADETNSYDRFHLVEGIWDSVTIGGHTPSENLGTLFAIFLNTSFVSHVQINDTLTLGKGTAQVNITMTSPDASEWCCGVDNSGIYSCSTGACA